MLCENICASDAIDARKTKINRRTSENVLGTLWVLAPAHGLYLFSPF